MKKASIVSIGLLVLCVFIGSNLQFSAARSVLANGKHVSMVQAGVCLYRMGSASPPGVSPQQIRTAYNLPSTGGSGTIAIIGIYDDPYIQTDLGTFDSQFNLTIPNFEKHMMSSDIQTGDLNRIAEISLDVEWAHAIAPSAKILLVETTDNFTELLSAIDYARNQSDVVAISMSWHINETEGPFSQPPPYAPTPFYNESLYDSYFTSHYGAAFFASSGDEANNVAWPAVSKNVVGVGGTTLTLNTNGSVASEVVWNNQYGITGGGISSYEAEPDYQYNFVPGYSYHRGVPDVSYAADPECGSSSGFSVCVEGQWGSIYGTSAGAPQWAAIYSLRPTASNPTLYAIAKSVYNSSCFRDITVGGNGNYNATAGYDFCTGLGSPLTGAFNSSLVGDINFNGWVNINDAILLGNAFLTNRTFPNWNALADLNNDGTVNILDAILLANHFNEKYNSGMEMPGQKLPSGPMTAGGPSIIVDPSQVIAFKGDVFNVNVELTNVTDLRGWQFQLCWNNTVLNCTNAVIQTPAEWQNEAQNFGLGLEENYNATNGVFDGAQCAEYPAPSFNGSMTITTFTFQALQPGTTTLTLTNTLLGNSTAQPIACTVSSGSVTVYYGRYMRGDNQTINRLNAYKLNIPESTSSASVNQSGLNTAPSWDIRVFVRHSDGTETEVVLDGQTGTPKAVVSGSGLRSATTSVSQTPLQSTDSLVVRVYMCSDSSWSLCASFTTEQLQASTLQAATWTVYYSVRTTFNRLYGYSGTFYWGTTTTTAAYKTYNTPRTIPYQYSPSFLFHS